MINKILQLTEKIKNNPVYLTLFFTGLGLFLLLFPNLTLELVFSIFGVVLVVKGILDLITYFKTREKENSTLLVTGIVEILAGINFVSLSYLIISFGCSIFGIYVIYNGIKQINSAKESKKYYNSNIIFMYVLGIITIVFGVIMTFIRPLLPIYIIIRIIGLFLIYLGITNFIVARQKQKDLDSLIDDE